MSVSERKSHLLFALLMAVVLTLPVFGLLTAPAKGAGTSASSVADAPEIDPTSTPRESDQPEAAPQNKNPLDTELPRQGSDSS